MKKLSKNLRYLDNISNTCNNTSISSKDLHDCYSQSFVNYKKLKNTFKNNNKSSLFGKQEILIEQLIEKDKIQKIYKYLILDKLCGSKNTNQKLNLIIL